MVSAFKSPLLFYVSDAVLPSLKHNFTQMVFCLKSTITKWQIALNTHSGLKVCPSLVAKLCYLVFWVLEAKSRTSDVDMLCVIVSSGGVVTCLMCTLH